MNQKYPLPIPPKCQEKEIYLQDISGPQGQCIIFLLPSERGLTAAVFILDTTSIQILPATPRDVALFPWHGRAENEFSKQNWEQRWKVQGHCQLSIRKDLQNGWSGWGERTLPVPAGTSQSEDVYIGKEQRRQMTAKPLQLTYSVVVNSLYAKEKSGKIIPQKEAFQLCSYCWYFLTINPTWVPPAWCYLGQLREILELTAMPFKFII